MAGYDTTVSASIQNFRETWKTKSVWMQLYTELEEVGQRHLGWCILDGLVEWGEVLGAETWYNDIPLPGKHGRLYYT